MIDFSLTEEQKAFQDLAREFVKKEIKPYIAEIDRKQDPKQCFPREIVNKGAKLGFLTFMIPEKYGGMGKGDLELAIIGEELAYGDIGVAQILCGGMVTLPIINFGTEEQKERWLRPMCSEREDAYLPAFGATEPSSASDMFCPYAGPNIGPKMTCRKEGNEYIINGRKCFVGNAGLAKLYGVLARNSLEKPLMETATVFYFSSDTPGFSVGKLEDFMGSRCVTHGELILEDVRLTKEDMIGEEGGGAPILFDTFCSAGIVTAAFSIGVARAAYEYGLEYAKTRTTWGKPIIEHQAVAIKLADMEIAIEAARALCWRAAWQNDAGKRDPMMASRVKIFASEMALKVTSDAIQLLGGYGLSTEYPVEKYFRDARVTTIMTASNELMRLGLMMGR